MFATRTLKYANRINAEHSRRDLVLRGAVSAVRGRARAVRGEFFYLGASELIAESYHAHPKALTTAMTRVGSAVIFRGGAARRRRLSGRESEAR